MTGGLENLNIKIIVLQGQKVTKIEKLSWLGKKPSMPAQIEVKIRYRTKSEKASLYKNGQLVFENPVRAITSGQSAVLYTGEKLLGGGVIV